MDIQFLEPLFGYGLQAVVAFGIVGIVNHFWKAKFKKELSFEVKIALLTVVAFGAGFIPQDFGNFIVNKVKEATVVALAVHALWTVRRGGK